MDMRVWIFRRRHLQIAACAMLAVVAVTAYLWPGGVRAVAGQAAREIPIYSVDTVNKRIAISFDAAWGDEKTLKILDVLDQYNVKTTFFLVGFWVDAYPQHVQEIIARGHEIGNHSSTHPHMSELSADQIRMELNTTAQKIEALTDTKVALFRPPFGDYNNRLVETCREMGITPIQWDVDSLDWKNQGVEPMVQRVTSKVQPGSIVLFHNNSEYIVESLSIIIEKLQKQGYEIVPVSQLIYPGDWTVDHTGKQMKPQASSD